MELTLSNDRHIAYHRNKLDVKEFTIDLLTTAYQDEKFCKTIII